MTCARRAGYTPISIGGGYQHPSILAAAGSDHHLEDLADLSSLLACSKRLRGPTCRPREVGADRWSETASGVFRRGCQIDEVVGDDGVYAIAGAVECNRVLITVNGEQLPPKVSARLTPASYGVDGSPVIEMVSVSGSPSMSVAYG